MNEADPLSIFQKKGVFLPNMARDKIHTPVKEALIDDGWLVTDDPLYMKVGNLPIFIDLGAERVFGAWRFLVARVQGCNLAQSRE